MTEQVDELVAYSIRMCGPRDFEETAKVALWSVLMSAAHAIQDFDKFPLVDIDELSLELVSNRWDKTFVLKLKRKDSSRQNEE